MPVMLRSELEERLRLKGFEPDATDDTICCTPDGVIEMWVETCNGVVTKGSLCRYSSEEFRLKDSLRDFVEEFVDLVIDHELEEAGPDEH